MADILNYPQLNIIIMVFVGILGLLVGSFLNVCIYRIPKKESIVFGNSHCMSCGAEIKRYDLIPVLSYIILGGKCRGCGAKISPRYPVIEALNCVCWLVVYLRFGFSFESLIYTLFTSALIIVAMIDLDTMEVPPPLVVAIAVLGVGALFLPDMPFWERLIGFVAASVLLLIAALASKGGMGGGDIKLMAVCGLVMGWKLILLSLLMAAILGAICGVTLMVANKKGRKSEMPFVPFLSLGMFFSLIAGDWLIAWYLGMFIK